MSKKPSRIYVLGLLSIVILTAVAWGGQKMFASVSSAKTKMSTHSLSVITKSGQKISFQTELALTFDEIATGLMFRQSMPQDHGMLFMFDDEMERSFWMKNTLIPLDMIFIKADGTIHHIHEEAQPHDLTGVPSKGPVKAVLEINGGMSRKLGISVGDTIKHELF